MLFECFCTITYTNMQKSNLLFALILGLSITFIACSKEDKSNTDTTVTLPAGVQDTVTSFMVFFTNTIDSSAEVASYDDPDGLGPKSPNIGGVTLNKNASYKITFFIEDATNPSKITYLHTKIKNNGKEYKICTSNPLGINVTAKDSDGTFPIGLVNDLLTSSTLGSDNMNFTVKYQKSVKNGQCSPGVVYFSCNIPISVQ